METPINSKTRRWLGVGIEIFSTRRLSIMTVFRVRVRKCASSSE
jgi:hypothetical protein